MALACIKPNAIPHVVPSVSGILRSNDNRHLHLSLLTTYICSTLMQYRIFKAVFCTSS